MEKTCLGVGAEGTALRRYNDDIGEEVAFIKGSVVFKGCGDSLAFY